MNAIFVLVDPSERARSASVTLDGVTRTLIKGEMSVEMWNAIFYSKDPIERAITYAANGWRVVQGEFDINGACTWTEVV